MKRDQFFRIAERHGFRHSKGKDKRLKGPALEALRKELKDYLQTDEGRAALDKSPPWHREAPLEEILDALLDEVRGG